MLKTTPSLPVNRFDKRLPVEEIMAMCMMWVKANV